MPVATIVSFRLGGNDGVGVESRKWERALRDIGYSIRRVAGTIEDEQRPDDVELPGLAISGDETPPDVPSVADLRAALDTELVVVENLCSLPLNESAARNVGTALSELTGAVVLRHHDVPWQRQHLRHHEDEFPPRIDGAMHATINLRTRRELQARGYLNACAIHNFFDLDAPPGDRAATRAAFGFAEDDIVLLQPSRAIPRKNVPGGVRVSGAIATQLGDRTVRYWLTGPAEDGYAPTLDRILERCTVPFTLGRASTAADAYAACDAVIFPSTWEGFGNPTIESVWAQRPAIVFPYPVLAEIAACGVRFFDWDDPAAFARFVVSPRESFLESNLRRARVSFSIAELGPTLAREFEAMGWKLP